MTSLPPIPDEAERAAMDVTGPPFQVTADALAAAWPHLYAAALRHAASTAPLPHNGTGEPSVNVSRLHRMADEATQ